MAFERSLAWRLMHGSPLEARLFFARFFARMAVECSYFIGVFGTATYMMESNAFGISAMMLIGNVFIVTGTALAGPVVDRFGPRKTLIISAALTAAVFLTYAALPESPLLLVVLLAAWSLLIGFTNTSFATFPPYLVEHAQLKGVNSLMATASFIALVAGPLLGGALVLVAPVKGVFVMAAFFFMAAVAVAWNLREQYRPVAARTQSERTSKLGYIVGGFKLTFTNPALRLLFMMGFFGYFAYGAFDSLETIFYRDVLDVSVDFLGWLTAALGVGCVLGSIVMVKLPRFFMSLRGLACMLLVTGLGTLLYVCTSSWVVAAVGQFITGLGFGMLNPTRDMLVQTMSALAITGRVMSVMSLGFQLSGVLPLLVAPFLAEAFGTQPVLIAASLITVAVGVTFIASIPSHLNQPRAAAEQSETA